MSSDLTELGHWECAETLDSEGYIFGSECAADGNAATETDVCAVTEAAAGVQQFLQT